MKQAISHHVVDGADNEQPRPKERGIESGYITASPQAAGNEPGKIQQLVLSTSPKLSPAEMKSIAAKTFTTQAFSKKNDVFFFVVLVLVNYNERHLLNWLRENSMRFPNKRFCLLAIASLALLSACENQSTCLPASFKDPNLEQFIRIELGGLEGELTDCQLKTLEEVSSADFVPIPEALKITDLSGIEQLTNLRKISFSFNSIEDLAPLAGLTNLEQLHLSQNRIQDISPLANLQKMRKLFLSANAIRDITALSQMRELEWLLIIENQITDIGPLEPLQNLTLLRLNNNQIETIAPLTKLSRLNELNLSHNQIQDIEPLAATEAWGSTLQLDLSHNPLSDRAINQDLPQLKQKGITVQY